MAGWGIGLGSFASGMESGYGLGQRIQDNNLNRQIKGLQLEQAQRSNEAAKRQEGVQQELSAAGNKAQADFEGAVSRGEAEKEHADDWFSKNYAPQIEALHLKNNDVEGAMKWSKWAADVGTKKTIRQMGSLIGELHSSANTGDYSGFEGELGKFYKTLPEDVQKRVGKFDGFRAETDEDGRFVATASFTDDKGKEKIYTWDNPTALRQSIEGWANPAALYTESMKGEAAASKYKSDLAEYAAKKGIDLRHSEAERAAGLKGKTPQERYAAAQEVLTKSSMDGGAPTDAQVRAYLKQQDDYAATATPGIGVPPPSPNVAAPAGDDAAAPPKQIVNQKTGKVVPAAPKPSAAVPDPAAAAGKPLPMPSAPASSVTAPRPGTAAPAASGQPAASSEPAWYQKAMSNVVNYGRTGYASGAPPEQTGAPPAAAAPPRAAAPAAAPAQPDPNRPQVPISGPNGWEASGIAPAEPATAAPRRSSRPQVQVGLGGATANKGTPLYVATPAAPDGMVRQGNIDLNRRPAVKNADGSVSTVRSISIGVGDKAVLIPTVIGGRVVSNEEAIAHFKKTGENLGVFKDAGSADQYAQALHQQQTPAAKPTRPAYAAPSGLVTPGLQ